MSLPWVAMAEQALGTRANIRWRTVDNVLRRQWTGSGKRRGKNLLDNQLQILPYLPFYLPFYAACPIT